MGLVDWLFGDDDEDQYKAQQAQAAAQAAGASEAQVALGNRGLDWQIKQYNDDAPNRQRLIDTSIKVSDAQLADAATARDRSAVSWGDWMSLGRPLQDTVVREASAYGGDADQAVQAGRAIADVNTQAANARGQSARDMAAMGINPNSGRFASANRGIDLSHAAMAAGSATNARTAARDKGMALRAGALSGMTGQQNVAGQSLGSGSSMSDAGLSAVRSGVNTYAPGASLVAGGFSQAGGAYGSQANMYGQQSGMWGTAAQNAANEMTGAEFLLSGAMNVGSAAVGRMKPW